MGVREFVGVLVKMVKVGVYVLVKVGVGVLVRVAVEVGVSLGVGVSVEVGVLDGVGVFVIVAVFVMVAVSVTVGVFDGVLVGRLASASWGRERATRKSSMIPRLVDVRWNASQSLAPPVKNSTIGQIGVTKG